MEARGLKRQDKVEYLQALEEQQLRNKRKRPPFVPFPAQEKIIRSKALEKYLFSGNGFSKTTLLVNWIHWAATGYNSITKEYTPVPSTIYLVVDDPSKIEQKILPEYRKWYEVDPDNIHKDGKPHPSRITYPNGSVLHIITHEVNMLKVEGIELTHLALDEPCPPHIFKGLYRGGRIKGRSLQVMLCGTPLYQPWVRTDIYEPWADGLMPHVECFFGSSSDNPHLPKDYEARFGTLLSENEKATRFRGEFFDASGQALIHLWQKEYHIIPNDYPWHQYNPCVVAIDPHGSKPHHAILMGADRDNHLVVLDEFKEKALGRSFMKSLINRGWFRDFHIVDIIYDSSGEADMTSGEGFKPFGKVINEVLREHKIGRARPTTFKDKSDEDFIERIKEVLYVPEPNAYGQRIPKLRFREGCVGAIKNVKQVQWQQDKKLGENKDKLDIRNQDYLACIKYALATNLYYYKQINSVPTSRKQGVYGL